MMGALAAASLFALAAAAGAGTRVPSAFEDAFEAAAAKAEPAVVNITTVEEQTLPPSHRFLFGGSEGELFRRSHGGDMRWEAEGTGSGVIVDARGDVVTNEHVVRGADVIKIGLTGVDGRRRTLTGRVVAKDASLDLALVRIGRPGTYPWLALADSGRTRVGEWVMAIGSPFDLAQTVTAGVVSALRQSLVIEDRRYFDLVQTDASINLGNSGGPLVDLDGRVVGINTAIFSPSGASAGVGFAIASSEVRDFLDAARAGRATERGWLGVELAPIDDVMRRRFSLRSPGGAMVNVVEEGSPAAKAGLARGDAVVSFDGRPVADDDDLARRVRRSAPGASALLGVERDGHVRSVRVGLVSRPPSADGVAAPRAPEARAKAPAGSWHGASFEDSPDGPRVARVAPGSPCFSYLMEGDIVRAVDRRPVKDAAALRAALAPADLAAGVLFDVEREGGPLWVSVRSP